MFVIEKKIAGRRWWLAVQWKPSSGRWTDQEAGRILFVNVPSARAVIRMMRDAGERGTETWRVTDTKARWWAGYLRRIEECRKRREQTAGGGKAVQTDADAEQAVLPVRAERPSP